jgi:hypothetical protein
MSEKTTRKAAPTKQVRRGPSRQARSAVPASSVVTRTKSVEKMAQVRLRADEAVWLDHSMRVLQISSTSEALREALRLLHREASEVEAATRIRSFYQGEPAPLPDGVVPVDEADLLAADNAEW